MNNSTQVKILQYISECKEYKEEAMRRKDKPGHFYYSGLLEGAQAIYSLIKDGDKSK